MSLSSLESAHYAYLAHIGPLDARAWKGRCFPAFAHVLFQLVWCCVADSELGLYIPNTPFSKITYEILDRKNEALVRISTDDGISLACCMREASKSAPLPWTRDRGDF
jgi:hypothetical protein